VATYKKTKNNMNLIPAKMLKAYRTGDLDITASWADLSASQIIDAKLLGAKFANIEADLAQEVADRTSAVEGEETRATAAEGVLSTNLATEVEDRTSAISALQADVD
jgi:hypothetical protein